MKKNQFWPFSFFKMFVFQNYEAWSFQSSDITATSSLCHNNVTMMSVLSPHNYAFWYCDITVLAYCDITLLSLWCHRQPPQLQERTCNGYEHGYAMHIVISPTNPVSKICIIKINFRYLLRYTNITVSILRNALGALHLRCHLEHEV